MSQMPYKQLYPWGKNESGSTAVEFALVGIPFILMIIGIIEMALMFTSQSLLEAANAEATRQIRIGAVQQGGGEDLFRDTLCDFASALIDCDNLQYQVIAIDSFQDAQGFPPPSFDEEGNLEDQSFDPGADNDIVMIRVVYRYQIITPMMQPLLTNTGDGKRTLLSTVVLQTEPYAF